ncbi:hypothetical protein R3P38DRAFT_2768405 [Favolaschia claudopus]|uniref:Uncharacterized protein n=1 Tax=Favolaschia claudopus TaxID=2862362 RepID=A0AAW0CQI4_9AGAR
MALRAHVRLWDTDLAELQAKSRELVVFSRELGGLVIVFWPTVNVVRLEADEVVKLVQQEKLHWPCFFSRLEGRPLPCHILMVGDGVSAYCHYAPVARCSFFLSLSPINIYGTAQLPFEYPRPLLLHPPYSKGLLSSLLLGRNEDSPVYPLNGPLQHAGHLGDHDPDIRQRSKAPLFIIDIAQRPAPYHHAVVVQTEPAMEGLETEEEKRILSKLFAGEELKGCELTYHAFMDLT